MSIVSLRTFPAEAAAAAALRAVDAVDAVLRHVALAREPQLAVVLLVVDHVDQVGEHLAAVTTDQYVRTACKGRESREKDV